MRNTIKLIAVLAVLWFVYQAWSHIAPTQELLKKAEENRREHLAHPIKQPESPEAFKARMDRETGINSQATTEATNQPPTDPAVQQVVAQDNGHWKPIVPDKLRADMARTDRETRINAQATTEATTQADAPFAQLINDVAAAEAASAAKNKLEVVKKFWKKDGFGAVVLWRVTFRNHGDKPIGNIVYRTTYKAETGDVVDRGGAAASLGDYTIRKVIEPGQTRTIEINDGFVNHEAFHAHFQVVSCEYIAKPLKSQAIKGNKARAEWAKLLD